MRMGDKIHTLRIEAGLTLQELGDKVGVGASTVRKWETGYIETVRSDKIQKLADALGVTPAHLMNWKDQSINIERVDSNSGVIGQNSGEIHIDNGKEFSKEEQELLRIFNNLDVKRRMELLMTAIRLEEETK